MYFLLSAVFNAQGNFWPVSKGWAWLNVLCWQAAIERQPMQTKTTADSDELHPCCRQYASKRRPQSTCKARHLSLPQLWFCTQYFLFSSYRLWGTAGSIRRVRCSRGCLMKSSGWRALHLQLYGAVTDWRFRVCLLAPVGMGAGRGWEQTVPVVGASTNPGHCM